MSNMNRGKTIEEMITERQAELAWQKHLDPVTDKASLTRSRKRVTALGNAIAKLRSADQSAWGEEAL